MRLNYIDNIDCLEGMKDIPDGSVDMVLCDLPYGTTQNKWDSGIPFAALWAEYDRVCKPNAAVVLFGSQPFTTELNHSNLKMFRYEWVWIKNNSTGFHSANKRPLKKHELISVFYRKQPTYNPQGLKVYGKINRRSSVGDNWAELKETKYTQQFTNYPTQLLEFPYDTLKLHPTQKPVALCEYLIKTYTHPGEVVLDNCMGSGTTAVACIRTGRNFIGFELNGEYHATCLERIAAETATTPETEDEEAWMA